MTLNLFSSIALSLALLLLLDAPAIESTFIQDILKEFEPSVDTTLVDISPVNNVSLEVKPMKIEAMEEKPTNELPSTEKVMEAIPTEDTPPAEPQLKLAEPCDPDTCQLPNCRCSGLTLPSEDFAGRESEIPQFITVTFDDAVNAINYLQYKKMFADLVNPDDCLARGTFFVSHEYTDYSKLNALYTEGHEIALHSITHGQGTDYWRNADVDVIMREFGQQLNIIEKFAKIDPKDVHGVRMPFLQLSGNNSFVAAQRLGLLYDSSWPTQQFKDPPMWPYTLDYLTVQDCQIKPCPNAAIPGFWVQPMVSWTDMQGYSCSMIDACVYPPKNTVNATYDWIMANFLRHYEQNRAPFGMYLHAAWFERGTHNFAAMRKFLEHVNTLPNVYITTPSRVLEYMKHPVLGKPFESCSKKPKVNCRPVSCNLSKGTDGQTRYMTVCDRCPQVYPWLDNPLGLRLKH